MIDQLTIDRIMSASKIEEVVGDYVSLRKKGANLIGLCPFHSEKTPSFVVSPSKGICHCFGCGKGGNSANFLMEVEQVNYYDALRLLAKKYGIEVIEKELTEEEKEKRNERDAMFSANEHAKTYFQKIMKENEEGRSVGLSYFRERGVSDESIKTFCLGYALKDKDAFTRNALQHGFKKETLIKTGLSIEYEYGTIDRFRGRVIYPVHTISGKIVAFGGRVLNKTDKAAKYVNSPESEIYHKSDQLYGIYQAKGEIVRQDMCYLVEGYMDVISMHQFGIKNVVASSGTSLTTGQIRMIHRFTENVTVMYDGDAAGIHASIRGIDMLLSEGLNIKVVSLPEGEDPDSYAQTHNSDETISYIKEHAVDFIRFKTLLFMKEAGEDPIKRAELIADIIKSISVIPNNIKRSVYVRECSRLMEIDENTLFSEIDKILRGQAAPSRIITRNPNEKNGNQNISQNPSLRTAEANADRSRPVSAEKEVTNPFFREEADLLRFVIKNGAVQIFTDYEGNWLTVTEYIKLTYIEENLEIHTDSFRKTMDAAEQYCSQKENQIALSDVFLKETLANKDEEARFYEEAEKKMEDLSRFLFNHTDPIVSQTAIKLGIDRYYMCRTQREQYGHDYIRFKNTLLTLLNAIRKKFIETEIIKLKSLLAVATQEKNEQRISEIFQQLQELNTIKVKLNN